MQKEPCYLRVIESRRLSNLGVCRRWQSGPRIGIGFPMRGDFRWLHGALSKRVVVG